MCGPSSLDQTQLYLERVAYLFPGPASLPARPAAAADGASSLATPVIFLLISLAAAALLRPRAAAAAGRVVSSPLPAALAPGSEVRGVGTHVVLVHWGHHVQVHEDVKEVIIIEVAHSTAGVVMPAALYRESLSK